MMYIEITALFPFISLPSSLSPLPLSLQVV